MKSKVHVIMCGSDMSAGGGVTAVSRNYLEYNGWGNIKIEYIATHINGNAAQKIIYFIQGYFKILTRLLAGRVDIFHLHVCDGGPFYRKSIILYTAKLFKKKVILHHHTDYTEFFTSISGVRQRIVKKALAAADINIVLGNHLVKVIKQYAPEANISVLHNAVKLAEENKYNANGDIILFLGWLLERKGVLDLLSAVKQIDNIIDKKYKIALCGQGDDEIKNKIEKIGINYRIAFIGWADKDKKKELMERTIVNVLPSYREGLPMTILETMAQGIPNIASNISTIPEVIEDGVNGFLIEPGNVEMLAQKLAKIINERNMRLEMSEKSYCMLKKKFTVPEHIEKVKQIYLSLV